MQSRFVLTIAAAMMAAMFWLLPLLFAAPATEAPGEPLSACRVTDGDTIRCGDERIRPLGLDAPEMPGHCRRGRTCAPGDPFASKASANEWLALGEVTIVRTGTDRYGRTLGTLQAGGQDFSCWQLQRGMAVYKSEWDDGDRVRARCPDAAHD